MRILLAAAPHRDTFGYSMPPPGLLRLGGELERAGIEVLLEDLAHDLAAGLLPEGDALGDASAERLIARGEVDVVGLSVMGATLPIALCIAKRIKTVRPEVAVWIGGPGTTGVDRALIERFAFVDAVVRGEGEVTVLEMCHAVANGAPLAGIAGVTWRDVHGAVQREVDREPIADLAVLPDYAWHLLPTIATYKRVTGSADGLVPVDSGRGCVYDCSFCTIGRFWSRRSRTLPARRLAEEVMHLLSMPGAKHAYLCHDIFGANRGQAIAFCDEMIARGSPVPFEVRARADHLDLELLQRMRQAGGYRVLVGVESADVRVRERNQKGMRRGTDMLALVDDCATAGITPILSLILGLPGEDEAALEATLDFCAQAALRAGVNLSLHLVNPQPGCGLGEEFGARARAVEGIPPDMALGAGETGPEREMIAAHPDLFTTFTLLPDDTDHLHDLRAIATELPEVLMRHPRTFALLRERDHGGHSGALETYRAWKADGRSFAVFARARRSPLIDDMVAWEQALVRTGASKSSDSGGSHEAGADDAGSAAGVIAPVTVRADVIEVAHDLPAVASGLRRSDRVARAQRTTWLAVLPARSGSPLSAVTTLRISRDVAELLRAIDGTRTQDELESEQPGIGRVLETLERSGLVHLGRARAHDTTERMKAGTTT